MALLLTALLLSGCAMNQSGASDTGSGSSGSGVAPGLAEPGVAVPAEGDAAGASDSAVRDVVTTGSLQLVVDDPIRSADDVSALVLATGGRLDSISQYPKSDYRPASATLLARIPEDRLDQALLDLKGLGTVQSLSTDSTDVTQQTTDYEVRIATLQAAVDRLRALLSTATDTSDLIEIETALTSREGDLESLKAQRDSLAEQVAFATISITLSTPAEVGTAAPGTFLDGLLAGFNSLMLTLAGLLIAFGAALPWLVFLAIVAAIVLLIVRFTRRRRRVRLAAARAAADAAAVRREPVAASAGGSADADTTGGTTP
ncbi:DUF4349 domain-containing protein [Naasia lichenicola]|uniref:DUF4349 domain-containing protein n=1 Tax=Naasia lichenicola TaxID=2565933 RepID=UPI00130E4AE9|nr:DUF4349 domain-containing protein [Naasia lichenicola]